MNVELRVCASCEWIFKFSDRDSFDCPKCGFGSYTAHYVYRKKAYRYAKTQKPWRRGKLLEYECKLDKEISDTVVDEPYGFGVA